MTYNLEVFLKLKLTIFIFSFLILTVFSGLAYKLISSSNLLDKDASDLNQASESVQIAKEIKSRLLTHNRNAFLYSIHKDPARLESRRSQRIEIERLLAEASQFINTNEEANLFANVRKELAEYFAKREKLKDENTSPSDQYDQISHDLYFLSTFDFCSDITFSRPILMHNSSKVI